MIFDSLTNFKTYTGVHRLFNIVGEYINNQDINGLPLGKHDIDSGIYAVVSEYLTKAISDGIVECHRKYIDIQILLDGSEKIGICNKSGCPQCGYDESKDFQKLTGRVDFIKLKANYFMVLFPDDGHMPQIKSGRKQEKVRKIVIKVPV